MFGGVTSTQAWYTVGSQDICVLVESMSTGASGRNGVLSIAGPTKQAPNSVAITSKRQFSNSWWGLHALTYTPPQTMRLTKYPVVLFEIPFLQLRTNPDTRASGSFKS